MTRIFKNAFRLPAKKRSSGSGRKRQIGRLLLLAGSLGFALHGSASAEPESVKIVGLGASTCAQYLQDVAAGTSTEREYFAWAQGFMSGVLMRAPPGKDLGLNLAPDAMPLPAQIQFIRRVCASDQGRGYSDAVVELFKELRTRQGRRTNSGAYQHADNTSGRPAIAEKLPQT